MKKKTVYVIILCVSLCGCGQNTALDDPETGKTEIVQNINVKNSEASTQNIADEVDDSVEQIANTEKNINTKEEYIQKMKDIYSEIKQEAATIGAEKPEILFHEVPWGSDLITGNKSLKEREEIDISLGMMNTPISISFILGIRTKFDTRYTDYSGIDNIGGIAIVLNKEMKVAGYNVEDCTLLFAAIEKDGEYILTNEDSALYAARYKIKPIDCETAKEDLKTKISSIYGEPDSTKGIASSENSEEANEYIYWYGANNTVLVLSSLDGRITISYVWLGGEELLNAALDNAEKKLSEDTESIYGNGNTDGL